MTEFFTIVAFEGLKPHLPQGLPGSYSNHSHVRSYSSLGKARGYRTMATNQSARWGDDAPVYKILHVVITESGDPYAAGWVE